MTFPCPTFGSPDFALLVRVELAVIRVDVGLVQGFLV